MSKEHRGMEEGAWLGFGVASHPRAARNCVEFSLRALVSLLGAPCGCAGLPVRPSQAGFHFIAVLTKAVLSGPHQPLLLPPRGEAFPVFLLGKGKANFPHPGPSRAPKGKSHTAAAAFATPPQKCGVWGIAELGVTPSAGWC